MNVYDFVHMALHAVGGEMKGKTKWQKTVYFLGEATDCADELGYRAHYYGPYSADVAAATDRLISLGFVDETISGGGLFNARGFEVARHDFRLNEKGKQVAELKARRRPDLSGKLKNAAAVLAEAGDPDYLRLSIAAKTYYMLGRRHGKATIAELTELATKFGWSVTQQEVSESARFLQDAKLVTLADTGD